MNRLSSYAAGLAVILFSGALFLFPAFAGEAGTGETAAWMELKTRYTKIRYKSPDDLRRFNRSIRFLPASGGLKWLEATAGGQTVEDRLRIKIDAIFVRVQEILDMRRKMERVSIALFPDEESMKAVYSRLYEAACNIRAWYVYEQNRIYLNVRDVNEGIVGHEIAHAIIDHYLTVRPPTASAEILARYVDAHLHAR